jgi:Protein of unknown function (DUF4232)
MGHVTVDLLLRNVSGRLCRLDSYPLLSLTSNGSTPVTLELVRGTVDFFTSPGPLAPGEFGLVTVEYTPSSPDPSCSSSGAARRAGPEAVVTLTFPDGSATRVALAGTVTAGEPQTVPVLVGCRGVQFRAGRAADQPTPAASAG